MLLVALQEHDFDMTLFMFCNIILKNRQALVSRDDLVRHLQVTDKCLTHTPKHSKFFNVNLSSSWRANFAMVWCCKVHYFGNSCSCWILFWLLALSKTISFSNLLSILHYNSNLSSKKLTRILCNYNITLYTFYLFKEDGGSITIDLMSLPSSLCKNITIGY